MKGLMGYYRALNRGNTNAPAFISTWRTTTTSTGSSASNQIKLPLVSTGVYNFIVNWGDSTEDIITVWNQAETLHTYSSTGDYVITITGIIEGFRFNTTGDRSKIRDISQFGSLVLTTDASFYGCNVLNFTATDAPVIASISLSNTFRDCTLFNSDISGWDVSGVTNFSFMFRFAIAFNQNIGSWNVSAGTNFSEMFRNSGAFNQNIGSWNVSAGTNLSGMFLSATTFNQNIGSWNVGNVTNFSSMFESATAFNQNISGWNVSAGTNFTNMFRLATNFNQNIGSWNVSAGSLFSRMFGNANAFNQNLGSWNVSAGTNFFGFMEGKTAANFSASNLDAIYNGWSLLTLATARSISFGTAKYTLAGQSGRDILTGSPNNWSITDGGI